MERMGDDGSIHILDLEKMTAICGETLKEGVVSVMDYNKYHFCIQCDIAEIALANDIKFNLEKIDEYSK